MFMATQEIRAPRRHGSVPRMRAVNSGGALLRTSATVQHSTAQTEAESLEQFGEWSAQSRWFMPQASYRSAIARWHALSGVSSTLTDDDWARCREALPRAFKAYRTLRLYCRSFFLPPGEATFEVLDNPISFPEAPPEPILRNFLRGISLYPKASFYYLEPVVKVEERKMTPLLRAGLEAEIAQEHRAVEALLRDRRWRYRTEEYAARIVNRVGDCSLELIATLLAGGMTMARALFTSAERLRLEMKAMEPEVMQGQTELRMLLEEAERRNMSRAAAVFASRLRKFDPIITFEVDGVHRLAGHWFHLKHGGATVLKWHD